MNLAHYSIKEFPYQYVYFNKIANLLGNPYKLFESDYSSTKYKEGAGWVRDSYLVDNPQFNTSDPETMLKVYACDNGYAVDYYSHKKFITIIHKEKANLILCDFRNQFRSGHEGEIIKEFYIDNNPVLYLILNSK